MANIVITEVTDKNYLKVDFGDYSTQTGISYRFFWPDDLEYIDKDGHVTCKLTGDPQMWYLVYDDDGKDKTMQVDSVLGVDPTDNNHLATLLANLKG